MPSWDRDLFVNPMRKMGTRVPAYTLYAYACTNLLPCMDEMHKDPKHFRPPPKLPESLWKDCSHAINAVVVCKDAVLIAEGLVKDGKSDRLAEWRLTALDRGAGVELWHVVLPAEPVFDGLTVDRAGRIVAALADGRIACYGE